VRIWMANQTGAAEEIIDLSCGGDYVVLIRDARGVQFHCVCAASFTFLECIAEGKALIEGLERALAVDPDFQLAPTLNHYVSLGIFVAASAGAPSNTGARS